MINLEAGTWGDTHVCIVIYDNIYHILTHIELYPCGHLIQGDGSKGFCNCKNGAK